MREILFRGKTKRSGVWVYGYFVNCADRYEPEDRIADIIEVNADREYVGEYSPLYAHSVDPETVGQYTGLTDKNGTKIFEGDIVRFVHAVREINRVFRDKPEVVKWDDQLAAFITVGEEQIWDYLCMDEYEVIGNIHDNPELLKGVE